MATVRPASILCEKWEPVSQGAKACRYYIEPNELGPEGMCKLPSEFLCVEWVRRFGTNEQRSALRAPSTTQPGGPRAPDPDDPPPLVLAPSVPRPVRAPAVVRTPQGEIAMAPPRPFEPAKEVDQESLEALERAGVEVELSAPHLDGGVTLVPARTGRTDRSELTFREAATVRMLVDAFPGCHVVAYRSRGIAHNVRSVTIGHVGAPAVESDEAWLETLENTCPGCGSRSRSVRLPDGKTLGSTGGPGPDGRCTACGAVKGGGATLVQGTVAIEEDPLS